MFEFLFGRKKEKQTAAPQPLPQARASGMAPGTHIAYHPELVEDLKRDHRQLLDLFGAIGDAHAAGDRAVVAALLGEFRSALSAHLLKENVRFYVYLEHALANEPGKRALVHQFRHDMDDIGKAVLAFLDRYAGIATDAALAHRFGVDLDAVGKVLVGRVRSEEDKLYALYRAV